MRLVPISRSGFLGIALAGRSTPITCSQPAEDLGGIWMRWPHPGSFPGDMAAARDRAQACAANSKQLPGNRPAPGGRPNVHVTKGQVYLGALPQTQPAVR